MKILDKKNWTLRKILLNKYSVTVFLFLVFITFFDNHNLIDRWKTARKIHELEKEQSFYDEEIKANKKKMNELKSSNENLEKFAREQYHMKKDNEDIFIIKE